MPKGGYKYDDDALAAEIGDKHPFKVILADGLWSDTLAITEADDYIHYPLTQSIYYMFYREDRLVCYVMIDQPNRRRIFWFRTEEEAVLFKLRS